MSFLSCSRACFSALMRSSDKSEREIPPQHNPAHTKFLMGPKTIQDSISSSVANGLLLLPYSLFAPNNNLRPYYIFTLSNEVDRFQSGLTTRKIHIHTKTEDVQKYGKHSIFHF